MANIISKSAQCQLSDNLFRTIYARVRFNSAAAAAAITASPLFNKDVIPYFFNGAQPTPADTGANIPTLANGLNSTVGIVAYTQDAEQLVNVELCPLTVADSGLGGTLTAAPVVLADLGGAGATGVSASKNLCFRVTLTGLTLDGGVGVHDFNLAITYKLNLQV